MPAILLDLLLAAFAVLDLPAASPSLEPGPAPVSVPQDPPGATEIADIRAAQQQIQTLFEQGRFAEAAKAANALTRKYPKSADAWMVVATCHLRDDWNMRSDSRAEVAAERAHKLAGPRPDILFALSVAYYRQRRPQALETVQTLMGLPDIRLPPDRQASLLHIRATLLLRGEEVSDAHRAQALADLDRALQLLPRAAFLRLERARQRRLQDDYDGALEDLQVALEKDPGNVAVHYELKTCYVAVRNMDKARHHLQVWQLLLRLTDSIARTSAPDPKERVELLRQLRTLNPTDAQRRLDYVAQELEHGDLDRVAKEVVELRKDFPGIPMLPALEAEIQRRLRERSSDDG